MNNITTDNNHGAAKPIFAAMPTFKNLALKSLFCIGISGIAPVVLAIPDQTQPAIHKAAAANPVSGESATKLVNNALMTAATVRKIDSAQAKITLKHAAIANIGMPAMTMVFKVADPKLLNGLNVNDEVHFSAEKQGSSLVVTAIEKQLPTKTE